MRVNTGGLILVVIGVLLLLQNLGFLANVSLWKFWPLILVAIGVTMLFPKGTSGER